MKSKTPARWLLLFIPLLAVRAETENGLAPEVTDLNAQDVSYEKEKGLPYLKKPFISLAPREKKDQLPVGTLGKDGGDKKLVLKYARMLAEKSEDPKSGKTDSLLIAYKGKLLGPITRTTRCRSPSRIRRWPWVGPCNLATSP